MVESNKATINATVSPILKIQAEELVKKGYYSSVSDVVSAALTEFFHGRQITKPEKEVEADAATS